MDPTLPEARDLTVLARERLRVGPPPDWRKQCVLDLKYEPKIHGPVTSLLVEQQIHAELRQTYFRSALRLETMTAVRELSQWCIQFEPQTQSVVLHSVRIRRGDAEIEHLSLDRVQILRRESGLRGLVIDGWITLLLILEDVAPGDVLDCSYTVTTQHRLLPELAHCLFSLSAGVEVAKYQFAVRFDQRRVLQWKSHPTELAPTVEHEGAEVWWSWLGEKFFSPAPEAFEPSWQMNFPWIQVSECPDWQTVASAVHQAWKEEPAGDGLAKLIEKITSGCSDPLQRINQAIELVQDDYRYLSVNLELGAQIPASAETVIRRRYGDCKDMTFLLVRLLSALGVAARPVLVHAHWRGSVSGLLPSPNVFNHAIVEFEIGNEKRWVDATVKLQGGGALCRHVSDFGVGLPIDSASPGLVSVPKASLPAGSLDVKESFILDTAGHPSDLAVVVKATGAYADNLRWELANEGIDAFAKKRLQAFANKFSHATRTGPLQYQDDRRNNEFALAEVIEIRGFLRTTQNARVCFFSIQSEAMNTTLVLPSANPRRAPFVLPFPSNCVHTVQIYFPAMKSNLRPRSELKNPFFDFSRRTDLGPGILSETFSCSTKAAMVPAKDVPEHRKQVQAAWREATVGFRLPLGYTRARRRKDFGALPQLRHPAASGATSAPAQNIGPAPLPAGIAPAVASAPTAPAKEIPLPEPSAIVTVSEPEVVDVVKAGPMNGNCRWSMYILAGIIAALVMVWIFHQNGMHGLAWWISLSVIPAGIASLVLAVVGLAASAKHPDRYWQGKEGAIALLVVEGILAALATPFFIAEFDDAMSAMHALHPTEPKQTIASQPVLLHFEPYGFVFHAPGPPWRQADARRAGSQCVLALVRDKEITFTISMMKPQSESDGMQQTIESAKSDVFRGAISVKLLGEGTVVCKGLAGWQMEREINVQGRVSYTVDWLIATNGLGYRLMTWGAPEHASQVKAAADQFALDFELTERAP